MATRSIKELQSVSDEELISEHDKIAVHTQPGVDYYLEALSRRSNDRLCLLR